MPKPEAIAPGMKSAAQNGSIDFDLVVVGAGPGGYVAAIRAAQLGLRCAIVEKDNKLGGTCLLRGCIPTKSMLHSASVLRNAKYAAAYGVDADNVRVRFDGVQKARDGVIDKSAAGVSYLMKRNKIEVIQGHARLGKPGTLEVTHQGKVRTLTASKIVLATGSAPRSLPFLPQDNPNIVNSDQLLKLDRIPKSLAVLGAGAVGVEFASVFHTFGSAVSVIEVSPAFLPQEDPSISAEFLKCFKKQGITCLPGTKLTQAVSHGDGLTLHLEGAKAPKTLDVELLLVAVGRIPITQDLGLHNVGVVPEKSGHLKVDDQMRVLTSHQGTMQPAAGGCLFAIGDIVPSPMLAHTASAEGIYVAEVAAKHPTSPVDYRTNPGATYSEPEVASVGLTEPAAKEAGYDVKVGTYPFSALGKARVIGETEGMVKIVADKRYDEILGVHILGPHATDLIGEACLAIKTECTSEELARTIHAHPTLSEAILEAAHATHDRPIHL